MRDSLMDDYNISMKKTSLLLILLLTLSIGACSSNNDNSESFSSIISSQLTSKENEITKYQQKVHDIVLEEHNYAKAYFGDHIHDYDYALPHYQFKMDLLVKHFPDLKAIADEKVFPVADYGLMKKDVERITLYDSEGKPTLHTVPKNTIVIDIEPSSNLPVILRALAATLAKANYPRTVVRSGNDIYQLYKAKKPVGDIDIISGVDTKITNVFEYSPQVVETDSFIKLPISSNEVVLPETSHYVNIIFSDEYGKTWATGEYVPANQIYLHNVDHIESYEYRRFKGTIKLPTKYRNKDEYSRDFILTKKDDAHSYLYGTTQHEFCHVLGLADLYKKDNYNEDRIIMDYGDSIMFGTTDFGKNDLKERDIDNIRRLYNSSFYQGLLDIREKYDPEHQISFWF